MANEFARNLKDASLSVTKAYPAAGSNNNSATIDLGSVPPAFQADRIEVEVSTPALSAFVTSTKYVTYNIQDSADDVTYANVGLTFQIAGVATTGSLANKTRFRLPSNVRRYIQLNQAETSGGEDITASSSTFSVLA